MRFARVMLLGPYQRAGARTWRVTPTQHLIYAVRPRLTSLLMRLEQLADMLTISSASCEMRRLGLDIDTNIVAPIIHAMIFCLKVVSRSSPSKTMITPRNHSDSIASRSQVSRSCVATSLRSIPCPNVKLLDRLNNLKVHRTSAPRHPAEGGGGGG